MTSRDSAGTSTIYDEPLLGILHNEGQIAPFLEVVFGFLHRRTDFFQPLAPDGKLGFPTGGAHKLVEDTFRKFARQAAERERLKTAEANPGGPKEVEDSKSPSPTTMASPETGEQRIIPTIIAQHVDDPGNGAVHDKFAWNQTDHDLDVRVYVPRSITKSNQLLVELTKTTMRISLKGENETILEGAFRRPIKSAESMWIFVPAEYVQLTLEKDTESWWDSLLVGEGKIDLSKIDSEISFPDMGNEEQQQIRKMIHDQKMMAEGKPTSSQEELAVILQKAWNVDGSPFKGQPFDPSIVSKSSSV